MPPPPAEAADAAPPAGERHAVLVGYGVKLGSTTRRPRKPGRPHPAAAAAARAPPAARRQPAPAALAKPPVRKLARDLGVDLADLAGTGPNGSITRGDVTAARPGPAGRRPVRQPRGRRPGRGRSGSRCAASASTPPPR